MEHWLKSLKNELHSIETGHRLREIEEIRGIDFLSNDYLSLNKNGILLQIFKETAENWEDRIGSTGSRLLQGHHESFERAESAFCEYTGHESSLLFQSGYSANSGCIPALISKNDFILSDKLIHASLIDGIRLSGAENIRFRHNDLNHLETLLKKRISNGRKTWIVTESIFSMDGDSPDLKSLSELADKYNSLLFIDEAHAIGVLGPRGRGLAVEAEILSKTAVCVYPMGKGPGLSGAFVSGSKYLKNILINKCRSFIFSTAQPPFLSEITARCIKFLQSDEADLLRKKVKSNATLLHKLLTENKLNTGSSYAHIIPLILSDSKTALDLAADLQEKNFAVKAIRPPSVPENSARLRLTVHADQTEHQIRSLSENILNSKTQ